MNERLDLEFIKRCNEMDKPFIDYAERRRKSRRLTYEINNCEMIRASQSFCDARRRLKYRQTKLNLSEEERESIRLFYLNRPDDHHVDHIKPLSKGGDHKLSNLQYLPAKENLRKHDKWEEEKS